MFLYVDARQIGKKVTFLSCLQATSGDPACAEHRHDMSLDTRRLVALKSTLRKGQDIWLEMYLQVFKNVCCLSLLRHASWKCLVHAEYSCILAFVVFCCMVA